MSLLEKLIVNIELHSVEGIRECFENGLSPNEILCGNPLIYELIGEYTRGPGFKKCVQVFIDFGLIFNDKVLLAVLADDPISLLGYLIANPNLVKKKYSLRCAYTPLHEVSLLHICAEFNHLSCAEVLVKSGADINAQAGYDEYGFGGQTPIFHTVNQNQHQSADLLDFLLNNGADVLRAIPGLVWGKGYQWQTLIPAVNPISYAMMGLLPQMHREEKTIMEVISQLLKAAYGIDYECPNIPNAYLQS